jgi:hypothetical protein
MHACWNVPQEKIGNSPNIVLLNLALPILSNGAKLYSYSDSPPSQRAGHTKSFLTDKLEWADMWFEPIEAKSPQDIYYEYPNVAIMHKDKLLYNIKKIDFRPERFRIVNLQNREILTHECITNGKTLLTRISMGLERGESGSDLYTIFEKIVKFYEDKGLTHS